MASLKQAFRAGLSAPAPRATRRAPLLLAGAGGPLGSAVLEQALATGGWSTVYALATQPIDVALQGLVALRVEDPPQADVALAGRAETALVVFDRERSFHGREAAFLRPQPQRLAALARWLQAQGVRRLVLVMPHAPALLPQALRHGLASLDEQAVAALDFAQLVIVRPARLGGEAAAHAPATLAHRLARALLAQLHWMVPQREQPLRAAKVAQFVVALARALPQAATGTRVAPPELLWDWAQPEGGERVLQAWLQRGEAPAVPAPPQRW